LEGIGFLRDLLYLTLPSSDCASKSISSDSSTTVYSMAGTPEYVLVECLIILVFVT
jgi:hypothetical protein